MQLVAAWRRLATSRSSSRADTPSSFRCASGVFGSTVAPCISRSFRNADSCLGLRALPHLVGDCYLPWRGLVGRG